MYLKLLHDQMKETAEEVEKTNEEVFRDREYQVRRTALLCSSSLQ